MPVIESAFGIITQQPAGAGTSAGLSAWFATHDSGQMPDDESEESPR